MPVQALVANAVQSLFFPPSSLLSKASSLPTSPGILLNPLRSTAKHPHPSLQPLQNSIPCRTSRRLSLHMALQSFATFGLA